MTMVANDFGSCFCVIEEESELSFFMGGVRAFFIIRGDGEFNGGFAFKIRGRTIILVFDGIGAGWGDRLGAPLRWVFSAILRPQTLLTVMTSFCVGHRTMSG